MLRLSFIPDDPRKCYAASGAFLVLAIAFVLGGNVLLSGGDPLTWRRPDPQIARATVHPKPEPPSLPPVIDPSTTLSQPVSPIEFDPSKTIVQPLTNDAATIAVSQTNVALAGTGVSVDTTGVDLATTTSIIEDTASVSKTTVPMVTEPLPVEPALVWTEPVVRRYRVLDGEWSANEDIDGERIRLFSVRPFDPASEAAARSLDLTLFDSSPSSHPDSGRTLRAVISETPMDSRTARFAASGSKLPSGEVSFWLRPHPTANSSAPLVLFEITDTGAGHLLKVELMPHADVNAKKGRWDIRASFIGAGLDSPPVVFTFAPSILRSGYWSYIDLSWTDRTADGATLSVNGKIQEASVTDAADPMSSQRLTVRLKSNIDDCSGGQTRVSGKHPKPGARFHIGANGLIRRQEPSGVSYHLQVRSLEAFSQLPPYGVLLLHATGECMAYHRPSAGGHIDIIQRGVFNTSAARAKYLPGDTTCELISLAVENSDALGKRRGAIAIVSTDPETPVGGEVAVFQDILTGYHATNPNAPPLLLFDRKVGRNSSALPDGARVYSTLVSVDAPNAVDPSERGGQFAMIETNESGQWLRGSNRIIRFFRDANKNYVAALETPYKINPKTQTVLTDAIGEGLPFASGVAVVRFLPTEDIIDAEIDRWVVFRAGAAADHEPRKEKRRPFRWLPAGAKGTNEFSLELPVLKLKGLDPLAFIESLSVSFADPAPAGYDIRVEIAFDGGEIEATRPALKSATLSLARGSKIAMTSLETPPDNVKLSEVGKIDPLCGAVRARVVLTGGMDLINNPPPDVVEISLTIRSSQQWVINWLRNIR